MTKEIKDGAVAQVNLDTLPTQTSAKKMLDALGGMDNIDALIGGDGEVEGAETPEVDVAAPAVVETPEEPEDTGTGTEDGEAGGEPQVHQIPKPRLDQEITKRREKEAENEELRTKLDALQGQFNAFLAGKNSAQPQANQDDGRNTLIERKNQVVAQFQNLEAQKREEEEKLDEAFDAGEIKSMKEYRALQRDLEGKFHSAKGKLSAEFRKIEGQLTAPTPDNVRQATMNDPALKFETERLMNANPWFDALSDMQVKSLLQTAEGLLRGELGRDLSHSVQDTWQLRLKMVEVAKNFGLDALAAQEPDAQVQDNIAAQKDAALKAKQGLANKFPPNLGQAGISAPAGQVTAKDLRSMQGQSASKIAKSISAAELDKIIQS